jgi:hypothetical protein
MNFVVGNGDKWWRFTKRVESALDRASDDLYREQGRRLNLGSPVIVEDESGDHVRAPIILRGGPREFPVCYVDFTEMSADGRRLRALADRALALARAAMSVPPSEARAAGKETTFSYP